MNGQSNWSTYDSGDVSSMPYRLGHACFGRWIDPNIQSTSGSLAAKFLFVAASASWCQWWYCGVVSRYRNGPNVNRTFACTASACTAANTANRPIVVVEKPSTKSGRYADERVNARSTG